MDAGLTNEADVCADNWADHGDDREEERGEPENTHSSAGTGGCWCNGRNKGKHYVVIESIKIGALFILNEPFYDG